MKRHWPIIALLCLLSAGCGRFSTVQPVEVDLYEGHDHLISQPEPLRVSGADPATKIDVRLKVRADGSVAGGARIGDRSPFDAAAVRIAKSARFRPFVRQGKAVPARVHLQIPVYPPEAWGKPKPFPDGDLAEASVTLERTGCFGSCPIYSVTVRGDGTISYRGEGYVLLEGEHTARIPAERAKALFERFRAERFFSARDIYQTEVTDNPTYVLSMTVGGKTKSVVDYVGLGAGMPAAIERLQDEVDRVSGSARWVKGDEQTLAALATARLTANSSVAGDILVRAAADAPDSVVLALIEAGFPMSGRRPGFGGEYEVSAAVVAAENGRAEIVRRLGAAGALNQSPSLRDEALRAAVMSGSAETVSAVLRFRPDPNGTDNSGRTALHLLSDAFRADESGVHIARLLLKSGADPNLVDRDGQTPLFGSWNPGVVQLLVDAGARLNVVSQHGETALLRTSSEDVALVLIRAGASLDEQNAEHQTALDRALEKRWWRAAAAIVLRGGRTGEATA